MGQFAPESILRTPHGQETARKSLPPGRIIFISIKPGYFCARSAPKDTSGDECIFRKHSLFLSFESTCLSKNIKIVIAKREVKTS